MTSSSPTPNPQESPRIIARDLVDEGVLVRCARHGRPNCISVPCMELRVMARALAEIDKEARKGGTRSTRLSAKLAAIRAILDGDAS